MGFSKGDLVSYIGVLQKRVHTQHGVVRLDARRGDLRARPDGERDLALLAVVDGEALEEQAAETGASAAAARLLPRNKHSRYRGYRILYRKISLQRQR